MNELKPTSKAERKFLDGAAAMKQNLVEIEVSYLARFLIQCTLPHSDPGDTPIWMRKNGEYTLAIQPGWDVENNRSMGYPYGTLPRLLLIWIITQAKRTNNPRLQLGHSLTEFMRELGLDPSRGHKNSERVRLQNAMQRLFDARISFYRHNAGDGVTNKRKNTVEIAPETNLWWDNDDPTQTPLWGSYIELGPKFFEMIMESTVPCNMVALRLLKKSPLALDLYVLCNWIGANLGNKSKHWISWVMLAQQLGVDYATTHDLKKKVKAAMRKVKLAHPGLNVGYDNTRGGLLIYPSLPAVPRTIAAKAANA
jgi:hypothetical protein